MYVSLLFLFPFHSTLLRSSHRLTINRSRNPLPSPSSRRLSLFPFFFQPSRTLDNVTLTAVTLTVPRPFNSIQFNSIRCAASILFILFHSSFLPPLRSLFSLVRHLSLSLSLSLTFSLRIFLDASRSRARLLLGLRRRLSAFHASSPSPNPGTPSTGRPA